MIIVKLKQFFKSKDAKSAIKIDFQHAKVIFLCSVVLSVSNIIALSKSFVKWLG